QLAQLDARPPVVQLGTPAAELEFEKEATVRIPFRVSDDYQVKTVTVRVRPEGGGPWTELPCNRTGGECAVEVAPAVHQNKTIELWVTATDLSDHKGQLGSAEKPQAIRRKHWYDRLRGKGQRGRKRRPGQGRALLPDRPGREQLVAVDLVAVLDLLGVFGEIDRDHGVRGDRPPLDGRGLEDPAPYRSDRSAVELVSHPTGDLGVDRAAVAVD